MSFLRLRPASLRRRREWNCQTVAASAAEAILRLPDGALCDGCDPRAEIRAKEPLLFRFQLKKPDGTFP